NQKLLVVSRGERKVQWVDFSADYNGGQVTKTLQDKNMRDPIKADENETNGSSVGVVTIASHEDKSILQYRYTTLFTHELYSSCKPNGCPTLEAHRAPAGEEFGGRLLLPGKPFAVRSGNVP